MEYNTCLVLLLFSSYCRLLLLLPPAALCLSRFESPVDLAHSCPSEICLVVDCSLCSFVQFCAVSCYPCCPGCFALVLQLKPRFDALLAMLGAKSGATVATAALKGPWRAVEKMVGEHREATSEQSRADSLVSCRW